MRIGINARLLLKNRMEGIGWHAFELISRLTAAHPDCEFILFYDRKQGIIIPPGENIKPVVIYPPSRHPLLIWWWCNALSRAVRKERMDVFYSPEVIMPNGVGIPEVITIHDLSPIVLPAGLPWTHRYYYRNIIPKNAKLSDHIITVSHFSKSEIQNHLKIAPEKISVIYNAARAIFQPLATSIKHAVRVQYTQGHPYFIYLGSIHDRKNVDKMIKAYDHFIQRNHSTHYLLLAGKFMGHHEKAKQALEESPFAKSILQLGYVEDMVLAKLLAAAEALINLSVYEGFGMPLVEAFQAGTPVIASNTSCYPEIAQQAAILVDPDNKDAIAEAMKQVIPNSDTYSQLGRVQAKKFDWSRSAEQVWQLISLLGSK